MFSSPLSPNFLRMIRDDFLRLLRSDDLRSMYGAGVDQRLARDLHDLGGMLGEW